MKRAAAIMMTAFMAFSLAACGGTPEDPAGQLPEEEPPKVQDEEQPKEKVTLLFEVDEGLNGVEFVSGCKNADGSYNWERMDLVLNNVYEGIKDLAPKFQPAVHIYFNWYYDADGWAGRDPSEPLNRWDPCLFYELDFFKEKGIPVYFEWISSGNWTNQNGEQGTLPVVDINLGTEGKEPNFVKGFSADIAAVKALHAAYPETFVGVRFHELVGTNRGGHEGNPHCFIIEEENVFALIDACADMGIRLIWSDHSWAEMYGEESAWFDRVKYAENTLGENFTLMWANNAGTYFVDYLNFKLYPQFKQDFPTAKLGLSAQDWVMSVYYLLGGTPEPVTGPGECDTPIELTAGFTLAAINEGATFIQYEPSYQFFNWPRSIYVCNVVGQGGDQPGKGKLMATYTPPTSQLEGDDFDYSPRLELKRLVDILNSGSQQFANIPDFYDDNMPRISAKSLQDPAKTYSQVTVAATTTDGENYYFDHYNNDASKWLEQNENRYTSRVFHENVLASARVLCNDHAYDEVVTAVNENGKKVGYFFNARSCLLSCNETIFADNDKGEFVAFTTANLIKAKVSSVNMDCDEIVVARKKGNTINLTLYQAIAKTVNTADKSGNFDYQEVTGNVDSYIVVKMLGGRELDAEGFLGLVGVRDAISIGRNSRLRNVDGLFAAYKTADGVKLVGRRDKGAEKAEIAIKTDGTVTAVAAGDWDLDLLMKDELLVAVEKDGNTVIQGYKLLSDTAVGRLTGTLEIKGKSLKHLATYRKAFFVFDTELER